MTCNHDQTYRAMNESNGGSGCPLCNQRRQLIDAVKNLLSAYRVRVVMVSINGAVKIDPEFAKEQS